LQWLAAFSFYAMKGPREAAVTGQSTVMVFFWMVVTLLLYKSHWLWAGLALGIALGKYSLSLPICLFLLLERRFRVLGVAALVQVIGLVVVALLKGGTVERTFWQSVVATLEVNWGMVAHHAGQAGIHLGFLLRNYPQFAMALVAILSLMTLAVVAYTWRLGWTEAHTLAVNSALLLWIIVAVYHRNYDTVMVIGFFVFCLSVIATWQLSPLHTMLLGIFYVLTLGVMCLPGEILGIFLGAERTELFILWLDRALSVVIVAMLAVNLWLLPRIQRVSFLT
jgi:hypothetical protein